MADSNQANDEKSKLAKAKLALTGDNKITDWKKDTEYLIKRKTEAVKALASDEQKKIEAEKEKARLAKIEAQKKLAELEEKRKIEETNKKKNLGDEQKKKDEEAEKKRQAQIEKILKSQEEINLIKKDPSAGPAPIRTLTRDIGKAVSKEGLSVGKIITSSPDEKKTIIPNRRTWLVGIGAVLVLGSLVFLTWSFVQRQITSIATTAPARQGLILANKQTAIDLTQKTPEQVRQELTTQFSQATTGQENIIEIYFTNQIQENTEKGLVFKTIESTPVTIIKSLNLNIPDEFLRFLEIKTMLGFYSGQTIEPFYLFQTKSYKNVADAMLKNESLITSELLTPFSDQTIINKIKTTNFSDKMVNNFDTRLVTDENNSTLALYAWLDKTTLIITTNELVFTKVLNSYSKP